MKNTHPPFLLSASQKTFPLWMIIVDEGSVFLQALIIVQNVLAL